MKSNPPPPHTIEVVNERFLFYQTQIDNLSKDPKKKDSVSLSLRLLNFWNLYKLKNYTEKAILIVMLFLNCTVFSQEHYIAFSAAVDIKNGISGSTPTGNKPALDVFYQASIITPCNVEINIGYESFNKIHFDKYTMGVGYHFPLYGRIGNSVIKTTLIPSIESTLIGRWGKEWQTTSSHLSIGGNLALRWNINDAIAVELLTNFLPRTDLKARYPEKHQKIPVITSNYFKIIYKIQRP